jgi:RNA polymerase sigma-70 factor (ECF subfamily)
MAAIDRSGMMELVQDLRLDRVVAHGGSGQLGATFEDFFDLEHERLLRAVYLMVGDRQEAEDIAQEAFIKVLERWDTIKTMDSPTGYLYRTAMNAFRSRYRRAAMAVRRIALLAPRQRNAFDDVEMTADVRRALTAVTPRQRAAIVLTELLGYGGEEAAAIMGIKPSTVRALTTQARARMKSALGGDHG